MSGLLFENNKHTIAKVQENANRHGENRQRNATVRVTTHGQTNTHTETDGKTDANRFYYLSYAMCYSYGADNNNVVLCCDIVSCRPLNLQQHHQHRAVCNCRCVLQVPRELSRLTWLRLRKHRAVKLIYVTCAQKLASSRLESDEKKETKHLPLH